jgi:predicted aspartyl protease
MLNKSDIISELKKQIERKVEYLNQSLESAIISRNSDTKSSAGDKFETSREMTQIEIHKIETEILKTKQQLQSLTINPSQLITTDKGVFFISIPFGKIKIENSELICISNSAPIAKLLLNTEITKQFNIAGVSYLVINKS